MKPLIEMTRSFGMMASNESETLQVSAGVNWFPVVDEVVRLLDFEVRHQITLRNYGNAAGARFLTSLLERIFLGPRHPTHGVCLTNGTSNAALLICNVLKEASGVSNLITLDPGYPHYAFLSDQLDFAPNFVSADLAGDLDQVANAIIGRVEQTSNSVICLIDPLNPSGRLLSNSHLRKIIGTARRRSSYVILDTVCLMPGDDWRLHKVMKLANEFDNLFIVGSNSKYAGLAGLRTGICVHPKTYTEKLTHAMLLQCLNPVVFGSVVNGLIWAARCSSSRAPHQTPEFIERSFNRYLEKLFREYPRDYNFKALLNLNISETIMRLPTQFSEVEANLKHNTSVVNQFCDVLGLQSPQRESGFNVLVPLSEVLPHLDEDTFFSLALKDGLGVLTSKNFSTSTNNNRQVWFIRLGLAMPAICFENAISRLQAFVLNQIDCNVFSQAAPEI